MSLMKSRKRSIPSNKSDDSDDDIEVIQIKKPRISIQRAKESKFRSVLSYMEESPRLKRFLTAIFSTFGYHYGETMEESDDEECEASESREINSYCFPTNNSERTNSLRHMSKSSYPIVSRKPEKPANTFVTLRQKQNSADKPIVVENPSSYVPHVSDSLSFDSIYSSQFSTDLEGALARSNKTSSELSKSKKEVISKTLKETRKAHSCPVRKDHHRDFSCDNSSLTNRTYSRQYDGQILSPKHNGNDFYPIEKSSVRCHKSPINGRISTKEICSSNGQELKTNLSENTDCSKFYSSNKQSASHQEKYFSSKSNFTTDEIASMQEKEQYRELVHRYCEDTWNSQTRFKSTRNAAVQVNLEDAISVGGSSFCLNQSRCIKQPNDGTLIDKLRSKSNSPEILVEGVLPGFKSIAYQSTYGLRSLPRHTYSRSEQMLSCLKNRRDDNFRTYRQRFNLTNDKDSLKRIKPIIAHHKIDSNDSSRKLQHSSTMDDLLCNKPSTSFELPEVICEDDDDSPLIIDFKASPANRNKNKDVALLSSIENSIETTSSSSDEPIVLSKNNHSENISNKSSVFFTDEWIRDLKRTMEVEKEEINRCAADQERKLEAYRQLKANKDSKFRESLQRPDFEPELVCLEDEKSFLPMLTPDMNFIIDEALAPHSPNEVMSTIANFTVLWKDIDTLNYSNWLNDEIINTYMFLIQERSKLENYPSVYVFTSFFYPKLKYHKYASVKRWTRKVDIFQYDLLLVPLHLGVHWCLAVIDCRYKKLKYYDSMDANENCLGILLDYLIAECADKKKERFDTSGWELLKMKDIPPQYNGSDCGMFTLMYAEYISRNSKIDFTQQDMPYFRRKTVYEIITGQIM